MAFFQAQTVLQVALIRDLVGHVFAFWGPAQFRIPPIHIDNSVQKVMAAENLLISKCEGHTCVVL
jgi:hypothetical protein